MDGSDQLTFATLRVDVNSTGAVSVCVGCVIASFDVMCMRCMSMFDTSRSATVPTSTSSKYFSFSLLLILIVIFPSSPSSSPSSLPSPSFPCVDGLYAFNRALCAALLRVGS